MKLIISVITTMFEKSFNTPPSRTNLNKIFFARMNTTKHKFCMHFEPIFSLLMLT